MKIFIKTVFFILMSISVFAQTADEIIANYFEAIGGLENYKNIKGIKVLAKVQQGEMDIPLEIVQMADGRTYTKVSFQGKSLMQDVFDGETMWGTNFQTMKAEKADAESSANKKLEANDFPSEFIDYKVKGYTLDFIGTETIDGAETFKLKLVKEPKTIAGEKVEDIVYYYFDTEAFILLVQESIINDGPRKGQMSQTKFSDFQEVDGIYFPFSMSQGIKDGFSQSIIVEAIELNSVIPDDVFKFPENQEENDDK